MLLQLKQQTSVRQRNKLSHRVIRTLVKLQRQGRNNKYFSRQERIPDIGQNLIWG